jgi:hypothetical protein
MMQSLCVDACSVLILVLVAKQDIRTARTAKALEVERTTFATLQLQPVVHHDILWMGTVPHLVA